MIIRERKFWLFPPHYSLPRIKWICRIVYVTDMWSSLWEGTPWKWLRKFNGGIGGIMWRGRPFSQTQNTENGGSWFRDAWPVLGADEGSWFRDALPAFGAEFLTETSSSKGGVLLTGYASSPKWGEAYKKKHLQFPMTRTEKITHQFLAMPLSLHPAKASNYWTW